MDATEIISRLGGTKKVIEITGLTRGRISQWRTENSIPKPWLLLFCERDPKLARDIQRAKRREMAA
jgi:hypothetical protein